MKRSKWMAGALVALVVIVRGGRCWALWQFERRAIRSASSSARDQAVRTSGLRHSATV